MNGTFVRSKEVKQEICFNVSRNRAHDIYLKGNFKMGNLIFKHAGQHRFPNKKPRTAGLSCFAINRKYSAKA